VTGNGLQVTGNIALLKSAVKRFCKPFLRKKRFAKPFYKSSNYDDGKNNRLQPATCYLQPAKKIFSVIDKQKTFIYASLFKIRSGVRGKR